MECRKPYNIQKLSGSITYHQRSIKDGRIHTKTFQKPMTLYIYISSLSAHVIRCFRGLIMGEILHYWNQNTEQEDFTERPQS
jgi:hypothetical protein